MVKTVNVDGFKNLSKVGLEILESLGETGFVYLKNAGLDFGLIPKAETEAFKFFDCLDFNPTLMGTYQMDAHLHGLRISKVKVVKGFDSLKARICV